MDRTLIRIFFLVLNLILDPLSEAILSLSVLLVILCARRLVAAMRYRLTGNIITTLDHLTQDGVV